MFLLYELHKRIQNAKDNNFQLSDANIETISASSRDFGKIRQVGNTAVIPIQGVLSQSRDFMAAWFGDGNTLYSDIIESVNTANGDPKTSSIMLHVGYSPGGYNTGLHAAMEAINASSKPVTAYVEYGAMSAAYGIVSQADKIIAASKGTQFGSVGVAMETWVDDKIVELSNTESPKKRPDLTTEEGRAVIREQLDEVYQLFASQIAKGRGTDMKSINENYGQGAVVLAKKALNKGMIDKIANSAPKIGAKTNSERKKAMNLDEFKAQYPDLYAQVLQEGVDSERDRVMAHVKMGEAFNAHDIALKAIKDNKEFSQSLQADYIIAGRKGDLRDKRAEDNLEAMPGNKTRGKPQTEMEALGEQLVADLMGEVQTNG